MILETLKEVLGTKKFTYRAVAKATNDFALTNEGGFGGVLCKVS